MLPERFNGDIDQKFKTLNDSSSPCFAVQVAELAVYLFSNNLICEANKDQFVKWLTEEKAADAVLKGIFTYCTIFPKIGFRNSRASRT
jgi:hypothetical protein